MAIKKLLIILGAAKCGTTSIANWMGQHPDFVLGREKEPRYFSDFSSRIWRGPASDQFNSTLLSTHDAYLRNFPGLSAEQWAIDASVDYLWCSKSPELIESYSRDCDIRLVCIVRDPIDRAVSEYNHTLRSNWETGSFAASIKKEGERIREGYVPLFHHARRSRVAEDIQSYHDRFGDKLLVLDYADVANTDEVLSRICAHCDADPIQPSDTSRKNESHLPRSRALVNLTQNPIVRRIARMLLPSSARSMIWQKLHVSSRKVQTVKPDEIAMFRNLLRDEIDACLASDLIPTSNWTTAVEGRGPIV